jgi:hypothetical protein
MGCGEERWIHPVAFPWQALPWKKEEVLRTRWNLTVWGLRFEAKSPVYEERGCSKDWTEQRRCDRSGDPWSLPILVPRKVTE